MGNLADSERIMGVDVGSSSALRIGRGLWMKATPDDHQDAFSATSG
jgi:hypothetical protein